MEHLPKRMGQTESIFPAIPYLCKEQYDEGPFLDYPHRLGLHDLTIDGRFPRAPSLTDTSRQFLTTIPPAEQEPFLQNWLFFGLLNEVLGTCIITSTLSLPTWMPESTRLS